ncbi:MAG: hypothetical protein JWO38_6918 [Gemmataceae bacterium]|nr:hypothetical protein [Gemmataceae bacterium]
MEHEPTRPAARLTALIAVAVTAGLLLAPLPPDFLGAWQGKLLDLGHVPLFAALVFALRAGIGPPLWRSLAVAIGLAGLAEIIQPTFGRTGDWADFVRGALGALSAAAVIRAWEGRRSAIRAVGFLLLAAGLWVWPVIDLGPYVLDTAAGYREFPVLAAFGTDRELLRWDCHQATFRRGAEPGGPPDGQVGRLDLLPGPDEYSYAALRPVVPDFRGHRWLCCEFRTVGGPVDLVISVRTGTDDPGRTTHTDVGRSYGEGTHTVRLDLGALAARARPDPLDLSAVRFVQFFAVRPREVRTVLLYRIWLEF